MLKSSNMLRISEDKRRNSEKVSGQTWEISPTLKQYILLTLSWEAYEKNHKTYNTLLHGSECSEYTIFNETLHVSTWKTVQKKLKLNVMLLNRHWENYNKEREGCRRDTARAW